MPSRWSRLKARPRARPCCPEPEGGGSEPVDVDTGLGFALLAPLTMGHFAVDPARDVGEEPALAWVNHPSHPSACSCFPHPAATRGQS